MDENKYILSSDQSSPTASEPSVSYQQINSITVPFDLLWNMIDAFQLTVRQKQTLIKRLLDSLSKKTVDDATPTYFEFPTLPKDFKISQTTLDHTLGKLPEGFDFDKEFIAQCINDN